MRKFMNIFAAALVMLAAASCEKNEVLPDNNSEGKVVTLKASINNGGTKTSLGPGVQEGSNPIQYPVYWSENDAIAVIQGEGEETKIFKFVLVDGISTTTGVFQLEAYENCGYEVEDFDATKEVKAFYPFEGISLKVDGSISSINYTVPATQTYTTTVVKEVVCSTFGNGASPMAAYADNAADGLSFENLFGVLKLQLTGAAGESLRGVEFVSDKAVSGSSIITINDRSSSIILAETPNIEQKKVVLECENPVELSTDPTAPTTVHIAVPGGVEHKFSVYIVTDKGAYYKKVSSAKEIVAGEIKKMGGLNLSGPEFEGKRMSYVENGVYLGEGIAQPEGSDNQFVWAPVNCGYTDDNKYGLLYKFGSNSGISYNGTIPTTIRGNSCPVGWRVPTIAELKTLTLNNWSTLQEVEGVKGLNFYIDEDKNTTSKIFLPAAGMLYVHLMEPTEFKYKDDKCVYWSSTKKDNMYAYYLIVSKGGNYYSSNTIMDVHANQGCAASVRCVRDVQ